jgi:hypothetical protein
MSITASVATYIIRMAIIATTTVHWHLLKVRKALTGGTPTVDVPPEADTRAVDIDRRREDRSPSAVRSWMVVGQIPRLASRLASSLSRRICAMSAAWLRGRRARVGRAPRPSSP